jgi:hypothetical protein
MTAHPLHPKLVPLERRLLSFGLARRRQFLYEGLAAAAGFFLAGLWFFFLLDYLTQVPYPVRLVLFFGGAGYGWYWFRRNFWGLYARAENAETVAQLLEHEQPELQSRLISTLQFQRQKDLPDGVSANLVDGLVTQTFTRYVDTLKYGNLIDRTWRKRRLLWLGGALAVWGLGFLLAPQVVAIFFGRLLLPLDYPRYTHITALELPAVIPEGEEFTLRVTATGELPEIGIVDLAPEVGERIRRDLTPTPEQRDTFTVELPALFCSAKLSVIIGDDARYDLAVTPEKRPAIQTISCEITPPPYTGLEPYRIENGSAQVPVGSQIKIVAVPNKKLQTFTVRSRKPAPFAPSGNETAAAEGAGANPAPDEFKPQLTANGAWEFSFVAERSLNYTFVLTDEFGLTAKDAPLYIINATPDRAPNVRVQQPIGAAELASRSRIPFIFEVRDDYQVARVEIKYQVYDAKEVDNNTSGEEVYTDRAQPIQTYKTFAEVGRALFSFNEDWQNPPRMVPGKIMRLWVEATDNHAHQTRSADLYLRVITDAEYRALLLKTLDEYMSGADGMVLSVKRIIRELERVGKAPETTGDDTD